MTSPRPLGAAPDRNRWRPLAADVRARIRRGEFAPGDQLPSNAALCARYGVSGQTVQHAMNSLRAEGLIETRAGRGWFARKPPAVLCLVRSARPGGPVARTTRLACGAEEDAWLDDVVTVLRHDVASVAVAADLRVPPGTEILVRERTMSEDGEVVALVSSSFPRAVTRGTVLETRDTGPGGAFACLVRLGHEVVRHVEQVAAGLAGNDETRRFGRADPPLVLRVVRLTVSRTRVLAVIHIVVLADRFELCYDLPVVP